MNDRHYDVISVYSIHNTVMPGIVDLITKRASK